MFKKLPHLLIYLFLLIFILQIAGLIVLFLLPQEAQAVKLAQFKPQVTIPNSDFVKDKPYTMEESTRPIGNYIQAIYKYSIGFVGILATVVLMIGGISFIVAGGNAERVGNAKAWIGSALTGLVLALASYMILNTINPDLVNFKVTLVKTVDKTSGHNNPMGCCQYNDGTCQNTMHAELCITGLDYFSSDSKKGTFNSDMVCNTNIGKCQTKKCCWYFYNDDTSECKKIFDENECRPPGNIRTGTQCDDYCE